MKNKYDVVVVGAGPAGSIAAKWVAESGLEVLVLEKDSDIGIPVRCAEGVGEIGLLAVLDEIRPAWVSQEIKGLCLIAPNDELVTFDNLPRGFVLNRKLFDFDLALMAAAAGAEIHTKAFVNGLMFENDYVAGVKFQAFGRNHEIRAKIVIGADGVESRVGRWAGLRHAFKMADVETCAQVTAANIDLDPDYCYLYFGEKRAPGGYVWAFPKGNRLYNIGLGIGGDRTNGGSAMSLLNAFLNHHFPSAPRLTTVVGGVPCAPPLKELAGNGVMLVGDAAHHSNPISGGGIARGMLAAKIAGQVAVAAIQKNDVSARVLNQYSKEWYQGEGKTHKLLYRIKEAIYHLTDHDLIVTARIMNQMPPEKRSVVSLFKSALVHKPGLIVDVIKAFA